MSPTGSGSRFSPNTVLVAVGLLILLVGVPGFVIASLGPPPGAPGQSAGAGSPSPGGSGSAAPSEVAASPTASPTPAPTEVPVVPVVSFWSTARSITLADLKRALQGRNDDYRRVVIPQGQREAIGQALDVRIPAGVREARPGAIRGAVAEGALGFLLLPDVTPAVQALAIGSQDLFGVDRIDSFDDWPILLTDATVDAGSIDPAGTWTLAAAGDILLDRGVARQVKVLKKGVDFPYQGGFVEITGSRCCSGLGNRVPTWKSTGGEGAVKDLISGADLMLANLESPVDDDFVYHTGGFTFSGDPALLKGVADAGIDFVSLANNHIGDAGPDGILDTVAELRRLKLSFSGAGASFNQARRPAMLQAGGVKVAVIGCSSIAGGANGYWTTGDRAGSYDCGSDDLPTLIRSTKRSSADIVIVFPHWGVEYQHRPTDSQRQLAAAWVKAGADLIIGNHPHYVAAMEEIDGALVWYALGNFVFDQSWSERTMEGVIIELTFRGRELQQVRLNPTFITEETQPNLMDPAGSGAVVIKQMKDASEGLLPY
jgi:poly-gamma-glutamate capsule biosynthesis protein CapA/YwtB (metallophosphatase superfamily)